MQFIGFILVFLLDVRVVSIITNAPPAKNPNAPLPYFTSDQALIILIAIVVNVIYFTWRHYKTTKWNGEERRRALRTPETKGGNNNAH